MTSRRPGRRAPKKAAPPALPALPGSATVPMHAVHVYRCELVEERVIAVPITQASKAQHAAAVLAHYLRNADRETFAVLLLDDCCQVMGVNTVAVGSLDQVNVTDREVFKPAILRLAEKIVIGHNHPIGTAEPSARDKELTRHLVKVGLLLRIPVIDHVIVAKNGSYFSFVEQGLMAEER